MASRAVGNKKTSAPKKMRAARKKATAARASRPPLLIEKSAGAVVFFRAEPLQYLLIRSTYWEFPKGLVDPAESEVDAARREVREETGLEISLVPDFCEVIQYFYRRRETGGLVKKQVIYYLGEAPTQQVHVSWEHQEALWVTFEQALERLQYENARAILTRANERLTA